MLCQNALILDKLVKVSAICQLDKNVQLVVHLRRIGLRWRMERASTHDKVTVELDYVRIGHLLENVQFVLHVCHLRVIRLHSRRASRN